MNDIAWLAARFEEHREYLRSLAYHMLGSLAEADDAVQDTWLRVGRTGASDLESVRGWFSTILARVCLNRLRARNRRREESLDAHVPDPVISLSPHPEEQAVLADSVGLALLVVLDSLTPPERLSFVLHDVFQLPYEEIAPLVTRSPAAARQLASRARRRIKDAQLPVPERDLARQHEVVDAFFSAARAGNFDALLPLLDSEVTLRIDAGHLYPAASMVVRGAEAVAEQARRGLGTIVRTADVRAALVNRAVGVIVLVNARPTAVMGFTIVAGRIAEIDAIADPDRVARIVADLPLPA